MPVVSIKVDQTLFAQKANEQSGQVQLRANRELEYYWYKRGYQGVAFPEASNKLRVLVQWFKSFLKA
jgi:hypothetical protein